MAYEWWVFLHVAGSFAFLTAHGVSVGVALRLRKERDPARVASLLDLSARTVPYFYASYGLLLAGGIVAAFDGGWWGYGWIWAAIATLVIITLAMIFMARPYYQRVRFISRAMAEGSKAVTAEQWDGVLMSSRPVTITWIGVVGLLFILYLMILKPALGMSPGGPEPVATGTGPVVTIAAEQLRFTTTTLSAPAGTAFSLRFENREAVPHNVAIYGDAGFSRSVVVGAIFAGPRTRIEEVPALTAGTYFFRCDVHPTTMTGTLKAE
ncbi:MAG TPA: cupredoxin domain-containing protein [Actinomycetota bacterium]|nr:cupredoxin domain-containing protein [Actinomycetota bacterium]